MIRNEKFRVALVVFDWAGTTVDHGCFAPVVPFMEALRSAGLEISVAEARGPMGLKKIDHLRALMQLPNVKNQWRQKHNADWNEADVVRLYETEFVPRQLAAAGGCSTLVPGLLKSVDALHHRGIKIATTTGYFAEAAEIVYGVAAQQGYKPDFNFNGGSVPAGRPQPWMMFAAMQAANVYPPSRVVKFGDTAPDMEEGRNAGAWCVGVTATGSELGLTAEEWAAKDDDEQRALHDRAEQMLRAAGGQYAIESVGKTDQLLRVLDDIEERIAAENT